MELLLVASEQLGGKAIGNVGRADGPLDVPEPGERTRCDGQPELVGNAARHPEAGIEAGVVELTLELGHAGAEVVELAASSKHAAIVCSGVGAPGSRRIPFTFLLPQPPRPNRGPAPQLSSAPKP